MGVDGGHHQQTLRVLMDGDIIRVGRPHRVEDVKVLEKVTR